MYTFDYIDEHSDSRKVVAGCINVMPFALKYLITEEKGFFVCWDNNPANEVHINETRQEIIEDIESGFLGNLDKNPVIAIRKFKTFERAESYAEILAPLLPDV